MGIMKNSEETRFNCEHGLANHRRMLFTDMPYFVCFTRSTAPPVLHRILDSCLCAVAALAAVLIVDNMLPLLEVDPEQDKSVLQF